MTTAQTARDRADEGPPDGSAAGGSTGGAVVGVDDTGTPAVAAVAVSVPPRRRTACSVGRRNGTDGHSRSCECSLTLRGKKRGMTGWFMR